ncbi:hypothetical protein K470DRAFT_254765 [Piedraia hortae CBS 480.64]|uniref:Asteroid domain-containing protein n=1 Tax=Piedraia hortae CBS 480.64 TaxID=1314780 RepID=A0A6A7C8S0_9PEZI|nr:hypothetical protein K470DRAFT_254765 [Piedraia hortae CBS 480.64]
MFLPMLLEDPARKAAWNTGLQVRRVAYALLPTRPKVSEYRRSGEMIREYDVAVEEDPAEVLDFLDEELAQNKSLSRRDCWLLISAQLALLEYEQMQPDTLKAALRQRDCSDWNEVHLSAQLQAAYYSLRMLYQIANFVKSLDVCKRLETLPNIAEFFEPGRIEDSWIEDLLVRPGGRLSEND